MDKKVSRWEYVYDAQGRIAYEVFLDRHGQRLQSIIYSPPERSESGPVRSRNAYTISPFRAWLLLLPPGQGAGEIETVPEFGKDGSLAPQKGSCSAFTIY